MVIYHLQVQIQVWEGFSSGDNGILYDEGNPSKISNLPSFYIVIPPENGVPLNDSRGLYQPLQGFFLFSLPSSKLTKVDKDKGR